MIAAASGVLRRRPIRNGVRRRREEEKERSELGPSEGAIFGAVDDQKGDDPKERPDSGMRKHGDCKSGTRCAADAREKDAPCGLMQEVIKTFTCVFVSCNFATSCKRSSLSPGRSSACVCGRSRDKDSEVKKRSRRETESWTNHLWCAGAWPQLPNSDAPTKAPGHGP